MQTDAGGAVAEGVEGNNVAVSDVINVTPEYRATVQTDIVTANQGTPVPLRGRAFHPSDDSPAAFRFVTISVRVNNTRREITAFTKSDGTVTAVFQPLPNEGGLYTIGARLPRPARTEDPSQDQFSIIGMRADPPQVGLRMAPGTPVSGQVTLHNNSARPPLTGLTATVVGAAATLQVTARSRRRSPVPARRRSATR